MTTFIMLTRLNTDAVRSPRSLEQLERDVMKRIREECPSVEWLSSYAVLGPCDYLDVFIADDIIISKKEIWMCHIDNTRFIRTAVDNDLFARGACRQNGSEHRSGGI